MHDSRKTLLNVLIDNILNPLNMVIVIIFIILIANKSYLYLIPLALSLTVSIFQFVLNLKQHVFVKKENVRYHVLQNGGETEKVLSEIKIGDEVVLYPDDTVQFVGKVKKGIAFIDESSTNGVTAFTKKTVGSSVIKGMRIVEGSIVVEVTEREKRFARKINIKLSLIEKRLKILNLITALLVLTGILLAFIYDKINNTNSLNNVSKASIAAIPFLCNIIFVIFNYIKSKSSDPDMKIIDQTVMSEINDVDVVCLDKTGTITTGEYEVFKTVVLSQTSFKTISLDSNRGFEQTISNIIKTTNERGGYFTVLQDMFVYEVSKVIDDYSSLSNNGLYSAITIRGGKTYALGEVENFELSNSESVSSTINEYVSSGYRVLLLVESKNPLKLGLIDGKSTAIGMIVLEEKIKNNAKSLINYCLEKNKMVKVISGDKLAIVSELCRKAGLENQNLAVSVKGISFEQLDLLIDEYVVFADASPSQKAFIVSKLQKRKKKVLFIGDGDNDCPALKTACAAVALSTGSQNAKRCSQIVIRGDFASFDDLKNKAENTKGKINHLISMCFTQNMFAAFYMIAFAIAKFVNNNFSNPFEYQYLFIWTIFGIIVPVIILLLEPERTSYRQKGFYRNLTGDSLMMILPVGLIFIGQLLQYHGVGYFAIPSDMNELHETLITSKVACNLSYLAIIISSLIVVYNHYAPFNSYRMIGFMVTIIIPLIYAVLLGLNIDSLYIITQIDTRTIVPANYFAMLICVAACAALYIFVLNVIEIARGETDYAKNKSNS